MNESAAKLIPFITPIRKPKPTSNPSHSSCSFLPNKLQLLRTHLQNYYLFPPLYSRRSFPFCSNKQLPNQHRRKVIALSVILHVRRSRLSEQLSTASNTLLSLSLQVRRFLFAKRCELSSDNQTTKPSVVFLVLRTVIFTSGYAALS